MKLLIDTNVILDFLLNNPDFGEDARKIFALAAQDDTFEFVSSSAITDIFYIVRKSWHDTQAAQNVISDILNVLTIAEVGRKEIETALSLGWKDFEDAVQYAVALSNNIDVIITRNGKDFEANEIPAFSPREFLELSQNF